MPRLVQPMDSYSIYIHLPFCRSKCPYCDFFSEPTSFVPFAAYRHALTREWQLRRPFIDGRSIASIYLGGGTPSIWPADEIARLIEVFPSSAHETTVEVNPGDCSRSWFEALSSSGVNRFSIGGEALVDERLSFLGRRHKVQDVITSVAYARSTNAKSVSLDIIYGTPNHSMRALREELRRAVELGVDHISAYELTVRSGSAFDNFLRSSGTTLPDNDALASLWEEARETLCSLGFEHYEISNYSRPGHRCLHNERYWSGGVYLGLGNGAHGFLVDDQGVMSRYANAGPTGEYIRLLEERIGADPLTRGIGSQASSEVITKELYALERIMLGLRTDRGVNFEEVALFVSDTKYDEWAAIASLLEQRGLARRRGGWLTLQPKGMIHADTLAEAFF